MKSMNFIFCSFGALIFLLLVVVGSNFVAGAGDLTHAANCNQHTCMAAFKCFLDGRFGNGRTPDTGTTLLGGGNAKYGKCVCDPTTDQKYYDHKNDNCSEHPANGTGGHGVRCYRDEHAHILEYICIPALTCRVGGIEGTPGYADSFGSADATGKLEGKCVCGADKSKPAWNEMAKKCVAGSPEPSKPTSSSGSDQNVYASLSLTFGLVAAMGSFLILCTV